MSPIHVLYTDSIKTTLSNVIHLLEISKLAKLQKYSHITPFPLLVPRLVPRGCTGIYVLLFYHFPAILLPIILSWFTVQSTLLTDPIALFFAHLQPADHLPAHPLFTPYPAGTNLECFCLE